ncbi:HepT-like ribonuclease domain-containing protein [Shewanella xiamenensis]|uniref:DUF86 domain-containing protein n=1 Tax=Shewanella xiamenensis TaxID=332186 RepID=A0AAE4TMR5_9GAMM|nr:HepT-like ribonuclease domain-containing protein [Shewanella xiamenensis]MDV5389978.1 DUF86 domain-containing protein [Shewanella xiamenensis]
MEDQIEQQYHALLACILSDPFQFMICILYCPELSNIYQGSTVGRSNRSSRFYANSGSIWVQINTLYGLSDWRKVIGLRNGLFHDYLDISPEIIRSVISQGYSDSLFVFAEQGLECLSLKGD